MVSGQAGPPSTQCGLQPGCLRLSTPSFGFTSGQLCGIFLCWMRSPTFGPRHVPAWTLYGTQAGQSLLPATLWPRCCLPPRSLLYTHPSRSPWHLCFRWHCQVARPVSKGVITGKKEKARKASERTSPPHPLWQDGSAPQTRTNTRETRTGPAARRPGVIIFPASFHAGGQIGRKRWCQKTAQNFTPSRLYPQGGHQPCSPSVSPLPGSCSLALRKATCSRARLHCSDARQRQDPHLVSAGPTWRVRPARCCWAPHGHTSAVFGLDAFTVFLILLRPVGPQGTFILYR